MGIENFRIKGGGIKFLDFRIIKGGTDRLISYVKLCNLLQFACEFIVICAI